MRQTNDPTMLTPGKKGACPWCGQVRPGRCRRVPAGWFCAQHYLIRDSSTVIAPTPDPRFHAAEHDPQVLAAQLLESDARRTYDAAHQEWIAVVAAIARTRIAARNDPGEMTVSGGWRPSPQVREHAAHERELAGQLVQLAKVRDRASEDMQHAIRSTAQAHDDARARNGLPSAHGFRQTSSANDVIIPNLAG